MNERRDRLQRELEHLTKTFKAGIMTEKEFKKGKDRIEQKLKEIDEQMSRDDKSKEIIKDILEDSDNSSGKEEKEEPPYEKVIYSEEIDEDEDSSDESDKQAALKKKTQKSVKKKPMKKTVAARPRTKKKKSSNLSTYLIIIAIIVVILYSYRDSIGITGAAIKAPTEVTINSTDVVELDVYLDYSCKYAMDMQENLKLLKLAYLDNVNINYRFLPVDSESVRPMLALGCAKKQNVFWRYHKLLTSESAGRISDETLIRLFNGINTTEPDLKLDSEGFSSCLENEETKDDVAADMLAASEKAIDRCPTLVIDGDIFTGFRNADEISKILNERLA